MSLPPSDETTLSDPPSMVADLTVSDLPRGYAFGVTRYADVILRDAFPQRYAELISALDQYRIDAAELIAGGGNRAAHTARFDSLLKAQGWGKRNITISKTIDDRLIHATRGHEIDMVGEGPDDLDAYPGVAVEMEWNNKDPFFDRDLLNFQALHREGALAVGVMSHVNPNSSASSDPPSEGLPHRSIESRKREHSRKPDEQYELIEACSPGRTWKCSRGIRARAGQLGAHRPARTPSTASRRAHRVYASSSVRRGRQYP